MRKQARVSDVGLTLGRARGQAEGPPPGWEADGRRDCYRRPSGYCNHPERGATVLEMLFTVALAVTIVAAAVPALLGGVEEQRVRSAARYLAGRVRLARATAVARSRMVGLRFERVGADYQFATYEDGDRDGIRTVDVRDGTDRQIIAAERLTLRFKDTRFGFLDGVPPVEDHSADGSLDPIHAGAADIVSLSPQGSASSATLYICGPRRSQYAVRVLGTTGRTRVLEFNRASRRWLER